MHALPRQLGRVLSFAAPAGGMALWADVCPQVDVDAGVVAARRAGVLVGNGRNDALDGKRRHNLRLGFARHDPAELAAAVQRLARALPR